MRRLSLAPSVQALSLVLVLLLSALRPEGARAMEEVQTEDDFEAFLRAEADHELIVVCAIPRDRPGKSRALERRHCQIAEDTFAERDLDVVFVLYSGVYARGAASAQAYVVTAMPYPTGRAEIAHGERLPGKKKKRDETKSKSKSKSKSAPTRSALGMRDADWIKIAKSITIAAGVPEPPLAGGIAQLLDSKSFPPRRETGKIYVASLFAEIDDVDAAVDSGSASSEPGSALRPEYARDTKRKIMPFESAQIIREAFRMLVPAYVKFPPMPSDRAPKAEALRGRLAVNNFLPHLYAFAREDAPGFLEGQIDKGMNYVGTTFAGEIAPIYVLVPAGSNAADTEALLGIGLTSSEEAGTKGGEIKAVAAMIAKGEVVLMLYDPVTKYKTATKFDTCEAADPVKLAKVAQKMRGQVPDPAAVDGKRLPLPVPKSGVALMAELDPEGAKRGAIAMEEDEARRAREREAEDSALEDGVTIVGSSSSSKKKKKREKATMSAAGGAADVGVESKVEL